MMTLSVFPEDIFVAWGSKKTLRWETIVKKSATGLRKTMTNWAYPEFEIECSLVGLTDEQTVRVQGFICSLYGRLSPFLWWDFEDHREEAAAIGTGDGERTNFQLRRLMYKFPLPVTDIKADTLAVMADGAATEAYTLLDGGVIRFAEPPADGVAITAAFDYYWRVAFADDETEFEAQFLDTNKSSIKMVTAR